MAVHFRPEKVEEFEILDQGIAGVQGLQWCWPTTERIQQYSFYKVSEGGNFTLGYIHLATAALWILLLKLLAHHWFKFINMAEITICYCLLTLTTWLHNNLKKKMQWYSFQTQCGWLLYSWIYTSRVVFSSHLPLLRVVQRCHTRRPPWQRSSRVGDTRPGCWGRRHTGRCPSCSSDQGTWSRHKSGVPWQHEWRLTPSVLALPEMHSPLLEVKKNGESNFFFFYFR